MNREMIDHYKNLYPAGTRVKLISMEDEPQMPKGLEGTVQLVDDIGDIHITWDNGRTLSLIPGVDSFQLINYEQHQSFDMNM